jgi:hypothetical protein
MFVVAIKRFFHILEEKHVGKKDKHTFISIKSNDEADKFLMQKTMNG